MLRIIGGGVGVEGSMCLTTQHQGSKLGCRGGSRVAAGEILNLHLLCRYIWLSLFCYLGLIFLTLAGPWVLSPIFPCLFTSFNKWLSR